MMTIVRHLRAAAASTLLLMLPSAAIAATDAAAEPFGPRPRLFLEAPYAERLQALAQQRGSAVRRAIRDCDRIVADPDRYARDGYMGLDWARSLQTCLIAWKAGGKAAHADAALVYFTALLDDRTMVGDGAGGNRAAARDSGYAMRAHGPYTALAYDWLHAHPGMSDALKQRARVRFKAWTDWYAKEGYRARGPGTNYHAGYVMAATLIAIAQGGEAGADGAKLWRHVRDTIFGKDLLPAARDGVLVGGDWGEGWQYAPLSLVEYALAARAVGDHGIDVAPLGRWLDDVLLRHVYAATPSGTRTFALGDTQSGAANLRIRRETLEAVLVGPAAPQSKQWAQAELARYRKAPDLIGYLLFPVLAEAEQVTPQPFPRERAATAYYARGTSVLYARSSWQKSAVWFVAQCTGMIDVDHLPPKAANFTLTRAGSNLIVDPSPYGSLSSLTSNAPTIRSGVLPPEYLPSQAFWGRDTGFRWMRTLDGNALLARCDYADQYRIQDTPSDIPLAWRDFVLLPYADAGGAESATLLVLDRAQGRKAEQTLSLRFRSQAMLREDGRGASGERGRSALAIKRLASSSGTTTVRRLDAGDCFNDKRYTRGNCDAARFAVSEVGLLVDGPAASAAHQIEAAPRDALPAALRELDASGGKAWLVERGQRRWVVSIADGATPVEYEAPAATTTHIALPATARGTPSTHVVAGNGALGCAIRVGGANGTAMPGTPALFETTAACAARPLPSAAVASDAAVLAR